MPFEYSFTHDEIVDALAKAGGSIPDAAELLGCSHPTLWRWLKHIGYKGIKTRDRDGLKYDDIPLATCYAMWKERRNGTDIHVIAEKYDLKKRVVYQAIKRAKDDNAYRGGGGLAAHAAEEGVLPQRGARKGPGGDAKVRRESPRKGGKPS